MVWGGSAVRVVVGSVMIVVVALGAAAWGVVQALDDDGSSPAAVSPSPTSEPTPSAVPTPTPTPQPSFTPKPVPDPGKATSYGSCSRAIDVAVATREEIIRRARNGDPNGAISAAVSLNRIALANARCFQPAFVKSARELHLADLNREVPPGIQSVPAPCQQVATDAYRLLGLASGAAKESEGDLDLGAGIDALRRRHPLCISARDASRLKAELDKQLPTGS